MNFSHPCTSLFSGFCNLCLRYHFERLRDYARALHPAARAESRNLSKRYIRHKLLRVIVLPFSRVWKYPFLSGAGFQLQPFTEELWALFLAMWTRTECAMRMRESELLPLFCKLSHRRRRIQLVAWRRRGKKSIWRKCIASYGVQEAVSTLEIAYSVKP